MTIFDTLRYPIPDDIFNREQLNRIPRNILKEWLKQCIEKYPESTKGMVYDLDNPAIQTYVAMVDIMVWREVSRCSPFVGITSHEITLRVVKKNLADILQKTIAEYDGEYTDNFPSQISKSDLEI